MAKKNEEVKTVVWVFWILLAIIGVSMLFAGIQGSIQGNNIATCVMLIVVGIILLFIGLVMVLGRANIITNDIEMPKSSKNEEIRKAGRRLECKRNAKICGECIFCYSGMLEAPGSILCRKVSE